MNIEFAFLNLQKSRLKNNQNASANALRFIRPYELAHGGHILGSLDKEFQAHQRHRAGQRPKIKHAA